jgi:hypothetical protein
VPSSGSASFLLGLQLLHVYREALKKLDFALKQFVN